MRKVLIAVCDADGSYGEKLGEWISLQRGEKMQSVSFTLPERFLEYHRTHRQDIVLLGKGFYDNSQICAEIFKKPQNRNAQSQEEVLWMYLCDADEEGQVAKCIRQLPAINKYQSASRLLREIFSIYQDWAEEMPKASGGKTEVIGVYSPGHSIWQTPFALTFAQALVKKKKVLYVNLHECSGFKGWFHEDYERDLLDVMYLCLDGEVNVAHCVSSALYSLEGVDYIPPTEDGGCLGEIAAQDYLKFVDLLSEGSGYEVILVDFGMMLPGFFQLLAACSKVYIVTEPGEMQEAPLQQFQQMEERQEQAGLEQNLVYFTLPAIAEGAYPGEGKMQQWLWGTMGDFSRKLAGVACGTD